MRLKVEVCGRDAQGNLFAQSACARDTSYYGARVDGIECLKGPGDIVQIKYKGKTSKFRVVWVGLPGSKEHGHIGLRSLEPQKNIWKVKNVPRPGKSQPLPELSPGPIVVTTAPPRPAPERSSPEPQKSQPEPQKSGEKDSLSSQSDRRSYTRHRCLGTVDFRIAGNCTVMSGKLADVSLGGCYVQALGTCLPGTLLELAIHACNHRVHLNGRVTVADSSQGMGIEFVSGCEGLKHLPKLIEAVRRLAEIAAAPSIQPARAQRSKPLA